MQKIAYLEGLRGVAALGVVIFHIFLIFFPALITANLQQVHWNSNVELFLAKLPFLFLYNGNFYVCIFFVLSAYVLSYKFFSRKDTEIVIAMALRRYFRLVIPVFACVIFAYILLKFHFILNNEVYPIAHSMPIFFEIYQFEADLLHAVKDALWDCFFSFTVKTSYNAVLWTMGIELKGSFFVFAFLALFGGLKKRWLIYLIMSLFFADTYYLAFVFGLFLSDLFNSGDYNLTISNSKLVTAFCLILGSLLGSYESDNRNLIFQYLNFSFWANHGIDSTAFYHCVGAGLLVYGVLVSDFLQRLFSGQVCEFLGKISFSLYLIHIPIFSSLSSWLFLYGINHGMSYCLSVACSMIISLPVIMFAAYLMTKYVDAMAVNWSKNIGTYFLR